MQHLYKLSHTVFSNACFYSEIYVKMESFSEVKRTHLFCNALSAARDDISQTPASYQMETGIKQGKEKARGFALRCDNSLTFKSVTFASCLLLLFKHTICSIKTVITFR